MSDELENGMFTTVPWHRKGTIVSEAPSAHDALVLGGLDWGVQMRSLKAWVPSGPGEDAGGHFVEVPDNFATVRDSDEKVLGVVGNYYHVLQNAQAFEFFDNLLDQGVKYDACGSLKGGKVIWLTAKLPNGILIAGEQLHEMYLVLSTSHDGSRAVRVDVTPTCVVCMNTLNLSVRNSTQHWTIRHTESVEGRVAEARNALNMTFAYAEEYQKEMERLVDASFTNAEFDRLIRRVLPDKEAEASGNLSQDQFALMGVREHSAVIPHELRMTKYGALMAVSEYVDHHKARRGNNPDAKLNHLWWGDDKAVADRAFQLLVKS